MKVIGVLIGIIGAFLLASSVSPSLDLKKKTSGPFDDLKENWRVQFEYWRKGLYAPVQINPYFLLFGLGLTSLSLIILAAI
jgi:hypothetical protein